MFERVHFGDGVSIVAFGVMEDSRCADRVLCFRDDRLVIDTVLTSPDGEREAPFAIGTSHRVRGGIVTLAGTTTPASRAGAIQLGKYRFQFVYTPDRRP